MHILVQQYEMSGERNKNAAVLELSEKFVGLSASWLPQGIWSNKQKICLKKYSLMLEKYGKMSNSSNNI